MELLHGKLCACVLAESCLAEDWDPMQILCRNAQGLGTRAGAVQQTAQLRQDKSPLPLAYDIVPAPSSGAGHTAGLGAQS